MAQVTAWSPVAPRSVAPDSRDQSGLPLAPFTALSHSTGYARTIDRGPYGLEAFFCRSTRFAYRGIIAATTAFSAGTGYFAGTAINQHRNQDTQWVQSAIRAVGFAALTGQGFFFTYQFRRMVLVSAALFDGKCPKLPSYGDPGFNERQNEVNRLFFTASPKNIAPELHVVAQLADNIRPERLGPSNDPVNPHPVDTATLPKVLHGGGPLPPAEEIHPPRRRGAVPVNDGTSPLPPRVEFGGALALDMLDDGTVTWSKLPGQVVVDTGLTVTHGDDRKQILFPPPPASDNNVDDWVAGKVGWSDLGKEAAAFGVATADPCFGAAVLMRSCRSQRVISSPTLWLTGPAHKDLAKFAVGVVGVTAAGAGAWVYLGRAGVAAAAAW